MGWCMSCHRDELPITEEGKIAIAPRRSRGGIIIGEPPKSMKTIKGAVDCTACHQ